ncbi:MAG: hypothetical protein J6X36_03220 [Lachnospiraceae bacterium]|nr:hypothetical protein [Lachnospiraceae bacterium]
MAIKNLLKLRRLTAGIMASIMLFVVIFFTSFIALEAHHDCDCEEDCPICEAMAVCKDVLHNIGTTVLFAVVSVVSFFFVTLRVSEYVCDRFLWTPVSLGVRMNN